MKRLSLFMVTALAAIACNKSDFEVTNPNTSFEGTPMSITVEMPNSPGTKLGFDQSGETWITKWTEGDKLTALHYSGNAISNNRSSFTISDVTEDGKSATFDGSYDNSQEGMVLVYAGTKAENILSDQAALSLANQTISLSDENVAGALPEYSYMVSEQLDLQSAPSDYNSVAIKHLTAMMEMNLQLKNLPEGRTFSVSEISVGISQEDYDALKAKCEDEYTETPTFATLYNQESYDITKAIDQDGFTTASEEMGVYNLAIEGCEISSTNNSFTIPFNAFPFTVKQGEYFNITVVLTENNKESNAQFVAPINLQICNDKTGSDLEFGRGKHHTISYSYECSDKDFNYIWDGSSFKYAWEAEEALGEMVNGVYEIRSATQLAAMSYLVNNDNYAFGSYQYALVSNIDLNNKPWTAIGASENVFEGTFNGGSYLIKGLNINNTTSCQGLFGRAENATISDLSVAGSVNSNFNATAAGIVGIAKNSTIRNCYNSANIEGSNNIGGIVGVSDNSTIINCYNSGTTTSNQNIGGMVGYGYFTNIINCYNTATIKGKSSDVGGIVGQANKCSIINCYNYAEVTGTNTHIGGVVGLSSNSSSTSCYWNSDNFSGSGAGEDNSASTMNVTAMSAEQMGNDTFTQLMNNEACIYNKTSPSNRACSWVNSDNSLYPVLNPSEEPTYTLAKFEGEGTETNPYKISTAEDLHNLSKNINIGEEKYVSKYFELQKDIDLKNEEFTAIGVYNWSNHTFFSGIFNGNNKTIKGLYINKAEDFRQGVFGYVKGATIQNLTVEGSVLAHAYIAGVVAHAEGSKIINCCNKATVTAATPIPGKTTDYIAGVVAYCLSTTVIDCSNKGAISGQGGKVGGVAGYISSDSYAINCYNTANISAAGNYAGGVVGTASNEIANCYNTGDVYSSKNFVGGIVGESYSRISNCYNTGSFRGSSNMGGIVGNIGTAKNVTNCHWAEDVNEFAQYYKGIGGANDHDSGSTGSSNVGAEAMTMEAMKGSDFVTALNNGAYTYNTTAVGYPAVLPKIKVYSWKADSESENNGYPMQDLNVYPTGIVE